MIQRMEGQTLEELWAAVDKIQGLGREKEVIPLLAGELKRPGELARLGCAKALLHLADLKTREEAISTLVELVEKTKSIPVKAAAIQILGEYGDPEKVLDFLRGEFQKATHPKVLIPLAKALWDLDNVPEARAELVKLLKSSDPAVRNSAALALAEMDYFEGEVRDLLRELRRKPTPEGRLAAALYQNDKLARQLERGQEQGKLTLPGTDPQALLKEKEKFIRELEQKVEDLKSSSGGQSDPVIEELLKLINQYYVDPDLFDRRSLVIAASKGLAHSLDDFSSFLDPEETKKFLTDISGEYCGIGAQVNKPSREAALEILKPIYNGPAYEAGILTGDQIIEIDGVETDGLLLDDLIGRLKGPAGSAIKLKVYRRGWMEPKEFELKRRIIEVPSLASEMLPGNIGIIKLFQFGEKSAQEFEEALTALEKAGLEGLIIDLRNNPGGLLSAALKIVDLFVGLEDRPIVTQRGRENDGEETAIPNADKHPDYPLVVLVNSRSASASEIVSGALKDYHRATLIGQRTFGKGSVQKLIPLSPKAQSYLGGEARLRLTVKYYYLPSGKCIHTIRDKDGKVIPGKEGGVEPDLAVEPETYPSWLLEEFEKIRGSKKLVEYAARNFDQIKNFVLEGDGRDPSKYPGFDELYKSLDTHATPDQVRQLIRYQIRRRVEDSLGKELASDFQEDVQLQRAILEVLKKLNRDPAQNPRYAWMKEAEKGEKSDK
ncbi:MAG: HEAT repeat domain-containing protein [Planctomycetes bacterium]|nr:HEAT repeat domain-containing protein [Planctomycetota bacterium]